ncbi:M48 family metalloprotease [Massilia sp. IC2-477]|uniref:M48 family metalloprotease n=1 Tax=Massilia sp. IC2-477 TaxID=2887198 RepID=UPI001D130786|nr:M48 family metalloprotease [Massilia sp. IC2-477]MCC2956427.1 M48 family metalloprotease [Massilia sp. IC2-477]
MMRPRLRAVLLVTATMLAASAHAQETAEPAAGNFFTRLFASNDKPVLAKLTGQPFKPSSQAIGADRDLLNQRASGYGLIASDSLEAYANGVLEKLKAQAGIPGLPGKVYLSATDDLAAVTTADGNIYIGYRWFENLNAASFKYGQEDTLAALLAHELAHIALGHHNSDFLANAGKWLQRYYAQGMAIKTALDQKLQGTIALPERATNNLRKMQYMVEIMDGMLHPAWKRGQEEEADAVAVDLTRAAGYSYQEGVKRFLELNSSAELVQKERDDARLKTMRDDVESSLKEGKIDAAINGIAGQLGEQLQGMLTATHPDPAARLAKVSSYVAKHYPADWYEDAQAPVSTDYRKVALDKRNVELFEMYNNAFQLENLYSSMKPDDMRAAITLGDKITRKIGLAHVNRNNWLLFYGYARAVRYSSALAPEVASAMLPPAPARKGRKAKAAPPVPSDPSAQLALRADELEQALIASEAAMSFKPYEDSIKLALETGKRDRALQLLATTDKKFELARSTLPKTIGLYARANESKRASELVTYCHTTYIDMRDECNKASVVK